MIAPPLPSKSAHARAPTDALTIRRTPSPLSRRPGRLETHIAQVRNGAEALLARPRLPRGRDGPFLAAGSALVSLPNLWDGGGGSEVTEVLRRLGPASRTPRHTRARRRTHRRTRVCESRRIFLTEGLTTPPRPSSRALTLCGPAPLPPPPTHTHTQPSPLFVPPALCSGPLTNQEARAKRAIRASPRVRAPSRNSRAPRVTGRVPRARHFFAPADFSRRVEFARADFGARRRGRPSSPRVRNARNALAASVRGIANGRGPNPDAASPSAQRAALGARAGWRYLRRAAARGGVGTTS